MLAGAEAGCGVGRLGMVTGTSTCHMLLSRWGHVLQVTRAAGVQGAAAGAGGVGPLLVGSAARGLAAGGGAEQVRVYNVKTIYGEGPQAPTP